MAGRAFDAWVRHLESSELEGHRSVTMGYFKWIVVGFWGSDLQFWATWPSRLI